MTGRTRVLAAVLTATVLLMGAAALGSTPAGADGSRAVVNIGGSNRVISFGGSVSGIGALQMAASVETVSYGGQGVAVCRINGVGNPPVPGECLGEVSGRYWSYWRAAPNAGGFSYSGGGAGGSTVTDGWVEGWNFGNGPPPFSSFCAVAGCAPPPPPPPPVTTPPTAAPSGPTAGGSAAATANADSKAGGSKAGDSKAAGGKQAGADKKSGGATGGSAAADGSGSGPGSKGGSGSRGSGGGDGRDGQQASGPLVSRPDDGGSPWGVVAAVGGLAALGAGGVALRRRRRLSIPIE